MDDKNASEMNTLAAFDLKTDRYKLVIFFLASTYLLYHRKVK